MAAELNYQEAVEESLRHLTGVERTQGVNDHNFHSALCFFVTTIRILYVFVKFFVKLLF